MSSSGNSSTGTGGKKSLPEFAASLIGTTLDDRFRIDSAIGQGAMGTVFAATQLSVNRRVAVKVLREQISETSKRRFMREARAISSLNHPNIVQLVDFGERGQDGLLYLVMEYVEGLRMSRLNKKGRLHPNLIIELVSQLSSALAEAHSHGIVHRDLKPSNILLVITADGSLQLKVLDFGVAHTYEDAAELTATGVLCGTPAYMAPEQARGKMITPSVDLYALGVNMYQMLAGFRPFRGATPVEVAMKQIQASPPTLRDFVKQNLMPEELVQLTERLMAKEPELRPQTASEVRQRVLQIRRDLGWGPLVFDATASDAWSRWTQQKLGEHGGRPLRGEVQQSRSWSGSWSGQKGGTDRGNMAASQAALHDASGVREPPDSVEEPATVDSTPSAMKSEDSLPSRHGGGWDAFRSPESGDSFPSGVGSVDPHVLERDPSHAPSGPQDFATPSEETAHIYNVANAEALDASRAPDPGPPNRQHSGVQHAPQTPDPDDGGEFRAAAAASPVSDEEDKIETVIESTSASYQEMWQAKGEPDVTDSGGGGGTGPYDVDHLQTLVSQPDRRKGTVVTDEEPEEGTSATDIVRFALIAGCAFAVFIVVGWLLTRADPGDAPAEDPAQANAAAQVEPAQGSEGQTAPDEQGANTSATEARTDEGRRSANAGEKTRPKRRAGETVDDPSKEEQEKEAAPIDLFGDDEVGDPDREGEIVIEEKR